MKKLLFGLAIVVFATGTCFCVLHDWAAGAFNRKLAAAADRGSGSIVFQQVIRKSWERVYIFDCYTAPAQINHALGFAYLDRNVEAIEGSEGANLLLFVFGRRVVLSVLHPRGQGDFYPHSVGRAFTPEEAVFTIERRPEDARVVFNPRSRIGSTVGDVGGHP